MDQDQDTFTSIARTWRGGVLIILLMISACGDSPTGSVFDSIRRSQVVDPPFLLELEIEQLAYDSLRALKAKFFVENISNEAVAVDFTTRCLYGFRIEQHGEVLFDRNENSHCPTITFSQQTFFPNATYLYNISFAGLPEKFVKNMQDGVYQLSAFLAENNSEKVSAYFVLD